MNQRQRLSETNILKKQLSSQKIIEHAFNQIRKMVYPHQLAAIAEGKDLEETMPTARGQACVIAFDIIASSKIKHINSKDFFRNVFSRCNAIMQEEYDGLNLKARAYRIKEVGDGFLCSVGYPYNSISRNPAIDAVALADRFIQVLNEEQGILHPESPICCGIGLAIDTLAGFHPESGAKEYDIYGPALVLATRYEAMRKALFEGEKTSNIIILQDVVYRSLDPAHRALFNHLDLKEAGIVVRDDPSAVGLYYRLIRAESSAKQLDEPMKQAG